MSVAWVGVGVAATGVIAGSMASSNASDAAAQSSQNALDANAYQGEIAKSQYQDYQKTYQPLEQGMVAQAQNFDTPAAYDQAASNAQATTSQQIGLAQERLSRQPGLDPSSAAAQTGQTDLALRGAALGAGQQNAARTNIRDQAWARKMDALGLGKGLVTGASTGLANAAATANSIANSNNLNANQTASSVGSMVTGLGNTALKAYQGYQTNTTNQANTSNLQDWSLSQAGYQNPNYIGP